MNCGTPLARFPNFPFHGVLLVSLFVFLQQLSKNLKFMMTVRAHSDYRNLVLLNLFDHLKLAICAFSTHGI